MKCVSGGPNDGQVKIGSSCMPEPIVYKIHDGITNPGILSPCILKLMFQAWKRPGILSYPLPNEVAGGYIGFRPSVRPASHVRSVQVWLDPFHVYTSYQATSEGVSHAKNAGVLVVLVAFALNSRQGFLFEVNLCVIYTNGI